jgi:hypothetical protein
VLTFRFDRMITHHIIQTFVPSIFIVCLAWFSFFMGLDSIPGRVTLLVTSQLTLVTMFASTGEELPPVAYLKVIYTAILYHWVHAHLLLNPEDVLNEVLKIQNDMSQTKNIQLL